MTGLEAAKLKEEGNKAFVAWRLTEAIDLYSQAIAAAPTDAVYYANRSAALYEAGRYSEALKDIEEALALGTTAKITVKLCTRAARCALWSGNFDAAESWLAHNSLARGVGANSAASIRAHVAACMRASKAGELAPDKHGAALRSPGNVPHSLRANVHTLKPELFMRGHASPRSLLAGETRKSLHS